MRIIKHQMAAGKLSQTYLVLGALNREALIDIFQVKMADVLALEASPIKIGDVRSLGHWLGLKPHSSLRRLAILFGVEEMTLEAANALLKILEEPPPSAILVLQAEKLNRILPTIISRAQIVREKHTPDEAAPSNYTSVSKLKKLSIKERFDYAGLIYEDKVNLRRLINFWEREFQSRLLAGEDVRAEISSLEKTRHLLLGNTSVKFLLENLLLKFGNN